jgi:hypothetical protein
MSYPIRTFDKKNSPAKLYHYTSQQGLLGILKSNTLWATEIRYLNDASEYIYGTDLIKSIITERSSKAKGDEKEFFDILDETADVLSEFHFFVVSLSEKGDLLSQWRGYTHDGNGFSVGFDFVGLEKVADQTKDFQLVKCLYDPVEQKTAVNKILDNILTDWHRKKTAGPVKLEVGGKPASFTIAPPLYFKILCNFIAPAFKHPEFAEEAEWRLVAVFKDVKKFKLRPGKSMLIPYTEVDLRLGKSDKHAIPLVEIFVSPCPHPELARESAKSLLDTYDFRAGVRLSKIPFRNW